MVDYFEYPTWQLRNHVRWGERFIILRGPRFTGKTYFVRKVFEEFNVPYIYIDVAGIRKIKAPRSNFIQTVKKDLNGLQEYTKTNIDNLKFPNCRYVRCFLKQLEDREEHVYVVFDHAELLHPWETYGRVFKGEIDLGKYVHLVFVPASTPLLIKKMGIYDPDAPLFARWKKYVDLEYWGAGDVKRYLEERIPGIEENEIWYAYELTEGAPQFVMKYAEYRRRYPKKKSIEELKKFVREKVLEEIADSKWKQRILKVIAEETSSGRYMRLKTIQNILGDNNVKDMFIQEVVNTNFVYFDGNNIRLKPTILSYVL